MSAPLRVRSAVLIAASAVLATGCGSSSGGPDASGVQHVTIDGNDAMRFVPDRVVVHPGTVVVTLHDVGQEPHNIDFPTLHAVSPTITDGQSTSLILHVKAGQTYPFDCDIHVTEGMVGSLVVDG